MTQRSRRTRRNYCHCVLGVLCVFVATSAVSAQPQAPWFGTWQVNLARLTYPSPPTYVRQTCRIEPAGDRVRVVYDVVHRRGGVTHLEWVGRFDGQDYLLAGVEDYAVTNAYRAIDDRTYEVTQKSDGAVVAIARVTVSADGRTLTATTSSGSQGSTTTTVFEREN